VTRKFAGIWIPAAVWLDERLTATEKVLLAEVDSFTSREADYFKANETIAAFLGCSPTTVKRAIKHLTELGYIERTNFDGRRRSMRSTLDPADRPKWSDSQTTTNQQTDQKDPPARPKRTTSKTKRNTVEKTHELILPWGENFKGAWTEYLDYRRAAHRFKYANHFQQQVAIDDLLKMSNHDEQTAIAIIRQTIAKGWKGLFPLDRTRATGGAAGPKDTDKYRAYVESGTL